VLDLGCGTGALLPLLAAEGRFAVGLDRSPSMLAGAREGRGPQTALIRGDALDLPFADRSFGSVVVTFPAPYILDGRALDEVARIIRPGGAFVVVMSGRIERWTARRMPVRIALALFYGRKRSTRGTGGWTLSHPSLPGDWREIPTRDGFALTWVAHRV
jgi:SAM-dependent methyltransferase